MRVIKAQVRPGAGVRVIGDSGGQTDSQQLHGQICKRNLSYLLL